MPDEEQPPERPRSEPEIIPPDRGRQADRRRPPWDGAYHEARESHRIYVTRLGPFGVALLMLAIAAIVIIGMILLLGAVLIWLPVLIVIVAIAAVFRFLR